MSEPVVVGSIGAPYGVRGWVKINSFTDPKDNLFSYPWLLQKANAWQPVKIEEFRPHAGGFVARLADIFDRDQAALITNLKIAVEREALPDLEDDEYYWTDCHGLLVYNQDQVCLGKIVDIFATGANDVIVVKGDKGEYLIPFVLDSYVEDIDFDAQTMKVRWDLEL